jgi:hypothetical protein
VATKYFGVDKDRYQMDIYRDSSGRYDIYCPVHPPNTRGGDSATTHLYESGKVCIAAGAEARTFDRAVAQAAAFCEGYSHYQRTGAFPNGAKKVRT